MSFLLDTNICSAHIRRPAGLAHRFIQYGGRLFMPTIVLAELYAWANLRSDPSKLVTAIERDLLRDVQLLDFDRNCATQYGRVKIQMRKIGVTVAVVDLWTASVALANNLTLVTNNTKDFQSVPGLRLEDWLAP